MVLNHSTINYTENVAYTIKIHRLGGVDPGIEFSVEEHVSKEKYTAAQHDQMKSKSTIQFLIR